MRLSISLPISPEPANHYAKSLLVPGKLSAPLTYPISFIKGRHTAFPSRTINI